MVIRGDRNLVTIKYTIVIKLNHMEFKSPHYRVVSKILGTNFSW